jgi:hypothetical protein
MVKVLHSSQKFECLPFLNGGSYEIKIYGVEVPFVAWRPYWNP